MILYKYRNDSENTEAIIKEQVVWFSKPDALNDPFECSIQNISDVKIAKAIKHEMDEYNKINRSNWKSQKLATEKILRLIRSQGGFYANLYNGKEVYLNGKDRCYFVPKIKYILAQNIIENAGVFCLSEKFDNGLMWGHYGDGGKGIAIGFSISNKEEFNDFTDCCMLLKVDYSYKNIALEKIESTAVAMIADNNQQPCYFQIPSFNDSFLKSVFSTKNIEWSYEKEWRLVSQLSGKRKFKTHISEIVFGSKCHHATKIKYIKLSKNYLSYPVEFFEMVQAGRKYNKVKCSIGAEVTT